MSTTKRPLCGECVNGWLEDDVTGEILQRCPCRYTQQPVDPKTRRDEAMAATADANPEAINAAVRIITDTAHRLEVFSANDMRVELDAAQIPGPVVGAAFGKASRQGVIRRDGYVQSNLGSTNSHEIKQWRSLIWRPAVAS